jgi:TRAP-type mannitol/chloroaromatic compound transport system permease small subunit
LIEEIPGARVTTLAPGEQGFGDRFCTVGCFAKEHPMQRFIDRIDIMNQYISNGVSFLFVPMTLMAMYEVVMRYFLNSPTTWVWDVNVQCFSAIVVLGGAYALQQGGHVIMDIVVNKFQERTKLIVNLCVYVIFFVVILIAIWQTGMFAWNSLVIFEKASTILSPPIYPIKIGILIGVCLLFLQGVSLFIRNVMALRMLSNERKSL